ncbi:MAG TPA: colicin D domain-containing protein [Jatrophihabitans sp.]|jgi:hypothetical protein|nr:colicin D domain-containing protein [Jatrophihabitans sp.]
MSAVIELETEDFSIAAQLLERLGADPLELSVTSLSRTLDGCSAMAGSDPGALAWAGAYDPAARSALYAAQDAINAVHKLAGMFAHTARNYAAADAASIAHVPRTVADAVAALPSVGSYFLAMCPMTAAGGAGSAPAGWGLIEHAVGWVVWPNGHQDQLRTAAVAWRASAAAFDAAASRVVDAAAPPGADRLPEAADMRRVCRMVAAQLRELGEVHRGLGSACDQLAEHLDQAHHEVLSELESLLEWTAGIEAASGLLSFFTFGVSEAVGQAGEAARISATAARVAAIIERFAALARSLASSVALYAERADRIAGAMASLLDVRLSTAVLEHVRTLPSMLHLRELLAVRRLGTLAGNLPELVLTRSQLEAKFKHAEVFGVTLGRSKAGFEAFDAAVEKFIASPSTRRVIGTYRRKPVVLSYQIKSRVVVIQDLDGRFVSAWSLRNWQMIHVVRDRSLGGG